MFACGGLCSKYAERPGGPGAGTIALLRPAAVLGAARPNVTPLARPGVRPPPPPPPLRARVPLLAARAVRRGAPPTELLLEPPETAAQLPPPLEDGAPRRRRPMSAETKAKIAAAKRGSALSPETRAKISESMRARSLSLAHRFNIARARAGARHSPETRAKIAAAESATKARARRARLAARAGAAATAATADLRPAFGAEGPARRPADWRGSDGAASSAAADSDGAGAYYSSDPDVSATDYTDYSSDEGGAPPAPPLLAPAEMESAVVELAGLRVRLGAWMDAWEAKEGRKPDLTETSESHPAVYAAFVRYVALRDLVRRSSLALGELPAPRGS